MQEIVYEQNLETEFSVNWSAHSENQKGTVYLFTKKFVIEVLVQAQDLDQEYPALAEHLDLEPVEVQELFHNRPLV
jgi:hypothetical protein